MKLPENIKGRNRLRDAKIILSWEDGAVPTNLLAEKFSLTQRRIEQILKDNHAFVPIDKEWEKKKRIAKLNKYLASNNESKKDPVDILEQLRKEIEGDKIKVEGANLQPIINIINYGTKTTDNNSSGSLPAEQVRIRDFTASSEVQEHQLAQAGKEDNTGVKQVNP